MGKKWIKSNILDIIQVVALVGAAVTSIIVWLQRVPWYLVVLGMLFAVVLILVGINQYEARKERHKKKLTQLSDKEIEDTIRNWLDDPFFKFQRKDNTTCFFQFVVTDDFGRPVTISRTKKHPTYLQLTTAISLSNEHRERYEKLSLDKREGIMHGLRIEMARYGIGYQDISSDLKQAILDDVILLDNLLTDFYLTQRIFFVTGAFSLYSEVIAQQLMLFNEPNPRKEGSLT